MRPLPPALSETSITGGPAGSWKRDTTSARSRVLPSRRTNGSSARARAGSIRSSRLVHCENTSALWSSATAVDSASSSASSFDDVGALWPGTSDGWQAAWRRRSSASSAAITPPLSCLAVVAEQREDVFARRRAHGVVDGALAVAQLDAQDRVGARRQLGGDVLLEAAQHERADALAQRRGGARAPLGDRARVAIVEVASARRAGRGW